MKRHIPKCRTILFTELCPLRCQYCFLREKDSWTDAPGFTKEYLFSEFEKAAADGVEQITLTGGEPFVRWPWIKELMEKYGNRFHYDFNTCGYYFTEEILEFLSHYRCSFQLSVDGPGEISRWRRPNYKSNKYDYWDKVGPILRTLLYYFPTTPWKTIVSKRTIRFLPQIYNAASEIGFRTIQFELDMNEQTWREGHKEEFTPWTEKDWQEFYVAMLQISVLMAERISHNQIPTFPTVFLQSLRALLTPEPLTIDSIACGISNQRDTFSLYQVASDGQPRANSCLAQVAKEKNTTVSALLEEVDQRIAKGCPIDAACPGWQLCARFGCIKDYATSTGDILTPHEDICRMNKIYLQMALNFLDYCNKNCLEIPAYQTLIGRIRRESVCQIGLPDQD